MGEASLVTKKWHGSAFWGKEKGREEGGLGFVITHFEFLIFRIECRFLAVGNFKLQLVFVLVFFSFFKF